MKKKKFLKIVLIIIIALVLIWVLFLLIMSNIKITASKEVNFNEGKALLKYNINFNTSQVKKELKYDTEQDAQEEYLQYDQINQYLPEKQRKTITIKKNKIIIQMSIDDFINEIGINFDEINTSNYVVNFLKEKNFSVKTSLGAKIYFKYQENYLNRILESMGNPNQQIVEEYIKTIYQDIWKSFTTAWEY